MLTIKKNAVGLLILIGVFNAIGCKQNIDYQKQYVEAKSYFLPVWTLFSEGKLGKALAASDSLIYASKSPTLMMQLVRFEYKITIIDFIHGRETLKQTDTLFLYMDSALALIEQNHITTKKPDKYSLLLLLKAEALYQIHQPEKGNELFFKAEKFSEIHKDSFSLFLIADKMAFTCYRQKNFKQALIQFKKSLVLHGSVHLKDYYKASETINNIALCFSKLNQYDSAIFYYRRGLHLLFTNKDLAIPSGYNIANTKLITDRSKGVILGNLSHIYQMMGLVDTAIILAKQSIALNGTICCEQRDAQLVQMRLIDLYFEKHRLDSMYFQLQYLRKGLDSLPNAEPELNYNKQMATYYDFKREGAKAYPFLKLFIAKKDSLANVQQQDLESNIVKDLQLKYQDADLTLLKKDNQLSKLYLWVTGGLIVMALAIIALVYLNFKKSKSTNNTLTTLNIKINSQKTELEKANNDKDRILRVVAHDLRNPIGGIASLTQTMLNDGVEDEKNKQLLQLIERTSSNSLNLINELLQTNNQEQGSIEKQPTDITQLVQQTALMLQFKAKEKAQTIQTNLPQQAITLQISAEKIERVIGNLIGNAIKFSPQLATIVVALQQTETHILISVKDDGIGIPKAQLQEVFTMFGQAKRKGTDGEKSFGLGLSICKQIIEAHNGKIWVESEEGKGSIFTVSLPLYNM